MSFGVFESSIIVCTVPVKGNLYPLNVFPLCYIAAANLKEILFGIYVMERNAIMERNLLFEIK